MTARSSIAQELERQSVVPMESTIPRETTCEQWRRRRSAGPASCDHLHHTTTRYDCVAKPLTFLVVCPVCRTEKVIETRHYEPRFRPQPASGPAGATVHQLPVRGHAQPTWRAA
jgi:hypothetical protein